MKTAMKQIKKIMIIVLVCVLSFCGCANNSIVKQEDQVVSIQNKYDEEMSSKAVDNNEFQEYLLENLYATISANFSSDAYQVQDISIMYISKEYIEELEYNTKSNIYFGFTVEELSEIFEGKTYVFDVGDNNETIVKEFDFYDEDYSEIIKNFAIGGGVIVICATISIATGGTVSVIFYAAATTATKVAVTSAAIGGFISTGIEYYNTGNMEKAKMKGLKQASEDFKMGAIIGSTAGGISEYVKQASTASKMKYLNVQEKGQLAEKEVVAKYGGREQVAYLNGKEVAINTNGATRPDIVRKDSKGIVEAIEIKNYNLNSEISRTTLNNELKRQVSDRVKNLPEGSKQRIVLYTRGRNYSKELIKEVIENIKNACSDVYPDIPVETFY